MFTPSIIICITISLLTIIGYLSNKLPMGVVAMLSLIAFYLTKCINTADAMSYFGNQNLWLCVCMFICSAGFTRTQFVKNLAKKVNQLAKGSARKIFFGYMILGVILCQFIGQAVAEFSIVAPLLGASMDEIGVKRSKVMYPLVVALLATMAWLPMGAAYSFPMQVNSMFETFGITGFSMTVLNDMILRTPGIILVLIYVVTVGFNLAPDTPPVAINASEIVSKNDSEEKLPAFQEKCGEQFGSGVVLNPANLIDSSRFEIKTPEITISADPEYSYLVETQIINGRKYLLIPAEDGVEVNGFAVSITAAQKDD